MSILIKHMKMPASCDECFVRLSLCSAARKIAKSGGPRMWVPTTYRPDDCPLAEISQPHGRLIDADALRQTMYHEAFETDSPMQKWDSGCWIRYKMFERMEETAPTVIDAEGNAE